MSQEVTKEALSPTKEMNWNLRQMLASVFASIPRLFCPSTAISLFFVSYSLSLAATPSLGPQRFVFSFIYTPSTDPESNGRRRWPSTCGFCDPFSALQGILQISILKDVFLALIECVHPLLAFSWH